MPRRANVDRLLGEGRAIRVVGFFRQTTQRIDAFLEPVHLVFQFGVILYARLSLSLGALFTAVRKFEPSPRLAYVLMFLILGVRAAAVARRLGIVPP